MSLNSVSVWAALALMAGANAESAYDSESMPAGVVHFPLTRAPLSERLARRFAKRDDTTMIDLKGNTNMFSTELKIGSNGQVVTPLVDTGSSDLWVMDKSNPYCACISSSSTISKKQSNGKVTCYQSSIFDSSTSTTFSANTTSFSVLYGDSTFANGTYCQDDISYGGITVKNANFAHATEANSSTSVWGIGLAGLEATVITIGTSGNFEPIYSNLPMQMKEQGYIDSVSYSLWLNDVSASSGELLFGGVDHAKYSGSLLTVPLIPTYRNAKPNAFNITLNGIDLYQGNNNDTIISCALPALLDSGTTLMMLPTVILDPIMESIGGAYTVEGDCVVACGLSGGLRFDLSGIHIDVPFSEIEFPVGSDDLCVLGMSAASDSLILGDTFLRSAYVVYDLENYEVSLAPAVYNVSSSLIESIGSSVPSASQAPGYSSSALNTVFSTNIPTFFETGREDISFSVSTQPLPSGSSLHTTQGTISHRQTSLSHASATATGSASASSSSSASKSKSTNKKNGAPETAVSNGVLGSFIAFVSTLALAALI